MRTFKLKFFILLLFACSCTFMHAQKEIIISFNPQIATPYKYKIQSFAETSRDNISINGDYSLTFKKENNNFLVTDKFSKLAIKSGRELIFSLNLVQEQYSRQSVLKDFFNTQKLTRTLDTNGNQIKPWDVSFIKNHPYLRESDKRRISMVVDQLKSINTIMIYNKKLTINKSFKNTLSFENNLTNLNNKNIEAEYKLIDVVGNSAIFKFDLTLFTPIRNRKREIINKKKTVIEGMSIIEISTGIPLHNRMIITEGERKSIVVISKKGEPMQRLYLLRNLEHTFNKELTHNQGDNTDFYHKSKDKTLSNLQKLNSLIAIDSHSKQFGGRCYNLETSNTYIDKPLLLDIKELKGVTKSGKILFHQTFTNSENQQLFMKNEYFNKIPISNSFCGLKIASFELKAELKASYGLQETTIQKNGFEPSINKEIGILNWDDTKVTITLLDRYLTYYDSNGNEIQPKTVKNNFFDFKEDTVFNLKKENLTIDQVFLFSNCIPLTNDPSYTYTFDKKVASIKITKPEGKLSVKKTFNIKIPVKK